MTATTATAVTDQTADPLPYIITFAILFVIALGLLTWAIGKGFAANQCVLQPNIWCSDNWTCNNSCPTGDTTHNSCFQNIGPTGLASCIFGPNSAIANTCVAPTNGDTGAVACDCNQATSQQTNNCLSNCPQNLQQVNPGTTCCSVGSQNCPGAN